jgi:hypothetical protein
MTGAHTFAWRRAVSFIQRKRSVRFLLNPSPCPTALSSSASDIRASFADTSFDPECGRGNFDMNGHSGFAHRDVASQAVYSKAHQRKF